MITLDRLQNIIPPDQALANKALATSLKQIGGINNLSLPQLSLATGAVQTTRDLPQITALTQATPASVANYYINSLATGTGTNDNILVTDILGTATQLRPALDSESTAVDLSRTLLASGNTDILGIATQLRPALDSQLCCIGQLTTDPPGIHLVPITKFFSLAALNKSISCSG
jgi:hypothetical protein